MAITLYDITIPVLIRNLGNLVQLLRKAEAQAAYRGYPVALLLQSRLYPDMYELSRQVIRAANTATETVEVISGVSRAPAPAKVVHLDEHVDYLNQAINYLVSIKAHQLPDNDEVFFAVPGQNDNRYTALGYVLFFTLPNFYFHVTTAYNILRHNGVEIGKNDFLGLDKLAKPSFSLGGDV